MLVLVHFCRLWLQREFNFRSLCSAIFVLGLYSASRVPFGSLLVLPDVKGIPSCWGVGAAECLFVGDDYGDILPLVLLSCSGISGQRSNVLSPWVQEGFLDPVIPVAISLPVLPLLLDISQQKREISGPKRNESTSPVVDLVLPKDKLLSEGLLFDMVGE